MKTIRVRHGYPRRQQRVPYDVLFVSCRGRGGGKSRLKITKGYFRVQLVQNLNVKFRDIIARGCNIIYKKCFQFVFVCVRHCIYISLIKAVDKRNAQAQCVPYLDLGSVYPKYNIRDIGAI